MAYDKHRLDELEKRRQFLLAMDCMSLERLSRFGTKDAAAVLRETRIRYARELTRIANEAARLGA